MITAHDYAAADAVGLLQGLARGDFTRRELILSAHQQIELRNPDLGAVVYRGRLETALQLAETSVGPLAGLPFLVKDTGHHASWPTSLGSALFDNYYPPASTTMVSRMLAAGAVALGKTNVPEYGLSAATEPTRFGPTRNPWDPSRTAGGSSGGAAAAVASGMIPLAHGSDGGGSIRVPAAFCGLFGLKPSRGRVSSGPFAGEGWNGLVANHVLTKSVRDSALILDLIAGLSPGDPYCAPPAPRDGFRDLSGGRNLRIALTDSAPNGLGLDPECRKAALLTAARLEDLGHRVELASPAFDLQQAIDNLRIIFAVNAAMDTRDRCVALGRQMTSGCGVEPTTWSLVEEGLQYSATAFAGALAYAHTLGRQFAAFFNIYDLHLSPTTATAAWPIGHVTMAGTNVERYLTDLFARIPFTAQYNLTGQPAASIPSHRDSSGRPYGAQLAGRYGDEATVLATSAQLEGLAPWPVAPPAVGDVSVSESR